MSSPPIARLIHGHELTDALRRAWPNLCPASEAPDVLEVDETIATDAGDVVRIVPGTNSDPSLRVHALVGLTQASAEASRLRTSLSKKARRQLAKGDEVGVVAVPELAVVFVAAGLDPRLPLLRMLHDRRGLADLTAATVGHDSATVMLLSHRYRKRAVMRVAGTASSIVIKCYKIRSQLVADTYERGLSLSKAGLSPRPLWTDPERAAVAWEDLGIHRSSQWDVPDERSVKAAMGALRVLHDTHMKGLPVHLPASELTSAAKAVVLADRVWPVAAPLARRILASVARGVDSGRSGLRTTVHRDAHPGQFGEWDRVTTDLDTLSSSDPALDLGNYRAHLTLAGASELGDRMLDHYGSTPELRRRVTWYHDVSLLRIACQCLGGTARREMGMAALELLVGRERVK